MSLFTSEKDAEEFKQQLIYYFTQKNDPNIVEILRPSTLTSPWFSHDKLGGFDTYNLNLATPMDIYQIKR